jgi:hypothetical protein
MSLLMSLHDGGYSSLSVALDVVWEAVIWLHASPDVT